jgi:enhancing lycopene biosynthesis protein 2
MANVGVILSGCGVFDGSEIHEAVLTLLALQKAGANISFFAPDKAQMHVVNHFEGSPTDEARNILVESARISRGNISPLSDADVHDLDAILIPGGFGAAKNLSTFAVAGPSMSVTPSLERLLKQMHKAGKPMGFLCISPVIAAKLFGKQKVEVTVGAKCDASEAIESMGGIHVEKSAAEYHVDEKNNIISTPAYMIGQNMVDIEPGITGLVNEVLSRISS